MHSSLPPPANAAPEQAAPQLLLVESTEVIAQHAPLLGRRFRVAQASTGQAAMQLMQRLAPDFVVTELTLSDATGLEVCQAAKALRTPATVLVTTGDVTQVPRAIEAGCDAVLLKPFAPNLLYARLGRLLRARASELRIQTALQRAKAPHLSERTCLLFAGTNQRWPNTECPYCGHLGVTSFEFTSYRRAWYACLECRKVWLAKHQE